MAACALIAVTTLLPGKSATSRDFAWCIACGELGTLDVLLNIALFVPFGATLAAGHAGARRMLRIVAAALALSTAIEAVQLLVIRGRDPSLSDIVANTLGGLLGAAIVTGAARLATASHQTWRALAWAVTLGASGILLFGEWAVALSTPREPMYVQWLPQRPGYAAFRGELSALWLDTLALGPGSVVPVPLLPDAVLTGRIDLTAQLTAGPEPERVALIARLALRAGELVVLARQHDALLLRYRANAARAGLRSPMFAMRGAFAGDSARVLRIRAIKLPGAAELHAAEVENRSSTMTRRFVITTARAWSLLLPFNRGFGIEGVAGDALWLGLLFAPAAYAGARAERGARRWWPVALLGAALVCLTIVAPAAVASTASVAWLGAVLGSILGHWLGARHSHRTVAAEG